MAKMFVDAKVVTEKSAMINQDGSALTLTNTVRVLYDNTITNADLFVTLTRIRDRLAKGDLPTS